MPRGGRVVILLATVLAATMAAGCTTPSDSALASCTLEARDMPVWTAPDDAAEGTIALEITRDHGTELLKRVNATAQPGDSVLDVLMRHADVTTAYGGGFVTAIDGLESGYPDAQTDWFYEVNGASAMVGAADHDAAADDHIHWDHRAWGPAAPPGHFNSLPWQQATPIDASADWPDGPGVRTATADDAPWDLLSWAAHDGGRLTACGQSFDAPWTLTARADPIGSQRVLVIGDEIPAEPPAAGHAWIHHGDTTYEVSLP